MPCLESWHYCKIELRLASLAISSFKVWTHSRFEEDHAVMKQWERLSATMFSEPSLHWMSNSCLKACVTIYVDPTCPLVEKHYSTSAYNDS